MMVAGEPFLTYQHPSHSIHDFIDPSTYILTYCTVADVYAIVNHLSPCTLLSKIDFKNAFRLIPVRPTDGIYLTYFGKENITSTHACHSACDLPPVYSIT